MRNTNHTAKVPTNRATRGGGWIDCHVISIDRFRNHYQQSEDNIDNENDNDHDMIMAIMKSADLIG